MPCVRVVCWGWEVGSKRSGGCYPHVGGEEGDRGESCRPQERRRKRRGTESHRGLPRDSAQSLCPARSFPSARHPVTRVAVLTLGTSGQAPEHFWASDGFPTKN